MACQPRQASRRSSYLRLFSRMFSRSPRERHFFLRWDPRRGAPGSTCPCRRGRSSPPRSRRARRAPWGRSGAGSWLASLSRRSWRATSGGRASPSKRVAAWMVRDRYSMLASSAAAESASVSSVMKFCATHEAREDATQSRRRSASTRATNARASSTVGPRGGSAIVSGASGGTRAGVGATCGGGGGGSTSQAARATRRRSAGAVRVTPALLHGARRWGGGREGRACRQGWVGDAGGRGWVLPSTSERVPQYR